MCKKTSWSLFLILICLASSKEISQLGWAGINLFLGLLFLWTVVKIPALLDIGNGFYNCIFNKGRFVLGLCSNFAMLGLLANFFKKGHFKYRQPSLFADLVFAVLTIRGLLIGPKFWYLRNFPSIIRGFWTKKNYFWYKITNFYVFFWI